MTIFHNRKTCVDASHREAAVVHKKCDRCKVKRGRRKAYVIEKTSAVGFTMPTSGNRIRVVRKIMLCDGCYNKEIGDLRRRKF
jgi:hypothetical protein